MTAAIQRIRDSLVGLRMPRTLEVLDQVLQRLEQGQVSAIEAIDELLAEEYSSREARRIGMALNTARLTPIKTLEGFDFSFQPSLDRERIMALAQLEFIPRADVVHLLGPPGTGKSHLAAAIGFALVENGYRVLFARTTDLVQKLQRARQELALESALNRLDRFHLLILDDFTYLHKNEAESGVLFELISLRYERRSLLITANQPFQELARLFPSETVAVAPVDRLVHHSIILEMNAESYRRRAAQRQNTKPGRPAQYATRKNTATDENK